MADESALGYDPYEEALQRARAQDFLYASASAADAPPAVARSSAAADAPYAISSAPPDSVLPPAGRDPSFLGGMGERLGLQAAGIYDTHRPVPAGDIVLPSPGQDKLPSALNFEPGRNENVSPYNSIRTYNDLNKQYFLDNLPQGSDYSGFVKNQNYEPRDILRGVNEQQPTYLTRASYAGDVLAPYATGNATLGGRSSVEGVKDMFADRIKTMVGDMPPNIAEKFKIISGFRDAARQHEVNPGVTNSRHSYGMAVDTTTDPDVLNWINNTNGKYGVDYTLRHLPNEQNHLEMVDNGVRAPLPGRDAARTSQPMQTPSASAADQLAEYYHPVLKYENTLKQFPILNSQQIIAGPSSDEAPSKLEYWPPNEPGTPERPRPDYIPIDQAGLEIGSDATPMDILGDIVSHHMVKKDPVIKKHYESFQESLTPTQKELLQAQYMYYTKNEGETRSYDQWEKAVGLPAYFRGYAFGQWPADFNQKAYTPSQRYHFDQMMEYLRGNMHQDRSALNGAQ